MHKCESERLCTIMQAPRNNSEDVSITHNQIILTFSRGGSKVVAMQLNVLTKTLGNNLSDVFARADFFFFSPPRLSTLCGPGVTSNVSNIDPSDGAAN